VDGVHGFGVKNISVEELGCDFLVKTVYACLTPCIINTVEEVKQSIEALENIKS